MNIVIFGCDNAGKTHLAEALENALGGKQVHSRGNVPIESQLNFMDTELLTWQDPGIKIFDRFPIIEEEVYGNVLRGESKYNEYGNAFKRRYLDEVNLFIYAYPGLLSTLNWQGREQMDGVIDNVINIINQYNKVAYKLLNKGYKVMEFNYNSDSDYSKIISKVKEFIDEHHRD